jgi:hypothetical protein
MKPLYIALIAISSFLLLCCGGTLVCGKGLYDSAAKAGTDGENFSAKFLTEFGSGWNHKKVDSLIDKASFGSDYEPSMVGLANVLKTSYGDLVAVGKHTLGKYKAFKGTGGTQITTVHQFNSTFAKGTALVTITVRTQDNQQRIVAFRVSGIKANK